MDQRNKALLHREGNPQLAGNITQLELLAEKIKAQFVDPVDDEWHDLFDLDPDAARAFDIESGRSGRWRLSGLCMLGRIACARSARSCTSVDRAERQEELAEIRANRANVRAISDDAVQRVFRDFMQLDGDQKVELKSLVPLIHEARRGPEGRANIREPS